MGAFSGASFFGARYGWKWGVPAYTLAALTGASRVTSSWHFADDVVAGASISMLSTWMYTTTALAGFDRFINKRWTLDLFYGPFESQDNGQFSEPVDFAGNTFPADTPIESAWRMHDVRARATFNWIRGERVGLQLGAGIIGQKHYVRLTAPGIESVVNDVAILPYVHAGIDYSFFCGWALSVGVSWMEFQSDGMLNGTALVHWQIDPRWEMMAGYQFYDREIDSSELRNRVSYDLLMLGFAHSWR